MFIRFSVFLTAVFLACLHGLYSEPQKSSQNPKSDSRYEYREDHDPQGIGKFYKDREISHVMGHQGASWLDRPEREREEKPSLTIGALKVSPGQVVADIGAGTGVFTFLLSQEVGVKGRVLAVDIQPEMIQILGQRIRERGVSNVEMILGEEKDPKLPAGSLDLVLMVDVYHEFAYPWEMMQAICRGLKPGGRVAFVEYRAEDPSVPIKRLHKMSQKQVKLEMGPQPLRWVETIDLLPRQHVIIFERTEGQPATCNQLFLSPQQPGKNAVHREGQHQGGTRPQKDVGQESRLHRGVGVPVAEIDGGKANDG